MVFVEPSSSSAHPMSDFKARLLDHSLRHRLPNACLIKTWLVGLLVILLVSLARSSALAAAGFRDIASRAELL